MAGQAGALMAAATTARVRRAAFEALALGESNSLANYAYGYDAAGNRTNETSTAGVGALIKPLTWICLQEAGKVETVTLLLAGALLLAMGVILLAITPVKGRGQDPRVVAYRKASKPVLGAMAGVGLVLLVVGTVIV
jgi:hypothetical protein